MATVKSIIAAHLSQRQRSINKQVEREDLLSTDRLLCNIIRVDSVIAVPDRPGFVWCQEYSPSDDTSPFHAFNDKVQAREGLAVWVGPGLGGRREVLDWNNGTLVNTADYAAQKYLPTHHGDHEWPDFKPGPDVVNVYPRSLSMLHTYPGEGGALTISASPLRYIKSNVLVLFPGKNSLDISASQPASGLARFVGIYLDPDDNTLKSVNGATTGDSPAITPDSPAFPESAILSANVRLNGDQTVFSEVDIVDARQILDSSGAIDGTRVSKLVSPDGSVDPVISVDNNGDIGAGVAPSSVAKFRLLDASGPQLRIEFDATKFADFEVDTNHDLTIDPSSTGQIKLDATVTVIDEIQREGDADTKIGLDDDKISLTAGGLLMFEAVEIAGQDTLDLGDVAGGGDVDIDFNDGQLFLEGSSGDLTLGDGVSSAVLNVDGSVTSRDIRYQTNGVNRWLFRVDGTAESGGNAGSNFVISRRADNGALLSTAFTIERETGFFGLNVTIPSAMMDINQADSVANVPVLLLRQGDVDRPFTKFQGVAASADLTRSIVDDGDVTTATLVGWTKIEINDIGNQVTDGDYFTPFYSLA